MGISFYLPLSLILPKPARGEKVLLVRDDIIGDLVVSGSATIKWLLENGYNTYLVLRHNLLPVGRMLLPNENLIPVDMKKYKTSLSYRYRFLKHLRSMGFSNAIGSTISSSLNNDIVRNSGAARRWGYCRRPKDARRMRGMNAITAMPLMENGIYASVLEHERWFLSNIYGTEIAPLSPYAMINAKKYDYLPDSYIHYVADAGNPRRVYPRERLLPILMELAAEKRMKVVATALKPFEYKHEHCINLSGRLSLEELLHITAGAALVVGNESGPVHLSWVLGNKTAMFYGGGHYGRFLPKHCLLLTNKLPCFCCDWKCIYDTPLFPCIDINEAEVMRRLQTLL